MSLSQVPHEIFREIVAHLDRDISEDREALKNLRLTNSIFNDVSTPVLYHNQHLSLGNNPQDMLNRSSLLRKLSEAAENSAVHSTNRPFGLANVIKHITGLIFIPDVIVPLEFQKQTKWYDDNNTEHSFSNVTDDAPKLREAMAETAVKFVSRAMDFVDALPDLADNIHVLDIRVKYDGDNFEAVEEYFCKALSVFFWFTCSSASDDGDDMSNTGKYCSSKLRNASTLRFTSEEFDAPNYFIVPHTDFGISYEDAVNFFGTYPINLHRRTVQDVHNNGSDFEMFPQVKHLEFSYLIDEVNKQTNMWEHSSSDYSERSYLTRLIRHPESITFDAKECWMNMFDVSHDFSFDRLTRICLTEMVFMLKSFCDFFLSKVTNTLRHLELHRIDAFLQASSIVDVGLGDDYFGLLFDFCTQHLHELETFEFSELKYHDMYFNRPSDTSWWKDTEDMPKVIPDSGGRLRPIFSPFELDFKGLSRLRDRVKERREEKGLKPDGFLRFCEREEVMKKADIRSAKYLRLIEGDFQF